MVSKSHHILVIDIGTTATKGVIFDSKGTPVTMVRKNYPMLTPQPDWAEQDPEVVLKGVLEAIKEACQNKPMGVDIDAVSFSSQMYSIIALSPKGHPLSNSLIWSDRRSATTAEAFRQLPQAKEIYQSTGCPIDAIYPLSKIAWLKNTDQGKKASKFISIKEYVLHRLIGDYVADWSIASATGLFDIRQKRWHLQALELAGITENELSPLVSPKAIFNHWNPDVIRDIGIPQGTPCVIGGGDGALASIGVGAVGEGIAAVNVGTSAAARYMTSKPIIDPYGRLWTYLVDEGWWVIGGIVSSGGIVYDWFIQNMGPGEISPEKYEHETIDDMAAQIPPGAEDLLFIPYLSGEQCPVWDPHTTGSFSGLTLRHTRAHLARAVYEGIARSIARVINAIEEVIEPIEEVRITGGLMNSSTWLQIASDMFRTRIYVPETAEGSALGAAVMAWVALGMVPDILITRKMGRAKTYIEPNHQAHKYYQQQNKKAEKILEILKSTRPDLSSW
jgi:gluconokinase